MTFQVSQEKKCQVLVGLSWPWLILHPSPLSSHLLLLFPLLTQIHLHWSSCYSLNTPGMHLPLGLSPCPLCLQHFFSRNLHIAKPLLLSRICSNASSQGGLITHSKPQLSFPPQSLSLVYFLFFSIAFSIAFLTYHITYLFIMFIVYCLFLLLECKLHGGSDLCSVYWCILSAYNNAQHVVNVE